MNINKTSIILVRDIHKEQFKLSPATYHSFAPISKHLHNRYLLLNYRKKDNIGYIKQKNKDLWLYEKNGKPVWLPLHFKHNGYDCDYPTVYWIEYLDEPSFIIYKPFSYADNRLYYLKFFEDIAKIKVTWTKDINKVTIFSFDIVDHEEVVNDNRHSSWHDNKFIMRRT